MIPLEDEPLTEGQQELLRYLTEFFIGNDQLPPLQVVADHFKWRSKQAAADKVHILVRKGYLEKNEVGKLRFARARYATVVALVQSPPCAPLAKAPRKRKAPISESKWRTVP